MTAARKMERFLAQMYIFNEYKHKMSRLLNFDMGRKYEMDIRLTLQNTLHFHSKIYITAKSI